MPLYDYGCKDEECKNVWETFHKMAESGPSECPKCGSSNVMKLISAVHGKVELSGQELRAKNKEDAQKIKAKAASDENYCANLVGEAKYQNNATLQDKLKKL